MAKTLLTRKQRRGELRALLRDNQKTIWDDQTLNLCLDEGLALVQQRFPAVKLLFKTLTDDSQVFIALPEDCQRVVVVKLLDRAATPGLDLPEPVPLWSVSQLSTTYDVGTKLYTYTVAGATTLSRALVVSMDDSAYLQSGDVIGVWYVQAQVPWGSYQDVDLGTDLTTKDLVTTSLADGLAPLLLYAGARVAALRFAMQTIGPSGGREWAQEYEYAVKERDDLLAQLGTPPPGLSFKNGVF